MSTQEAREAARRFAANWLAGQGERFPSRAAEADLVRAGRYDNHSLVVTIELAILSAEVRVQDALAGAAPTKHVPVNNPGVTQWVFDWFNDYQPDEMLRCLAAYDAAQSYAKQPPTDA